MEQSAKAKITKDMTMGEIIEKWPGAAEVMQAYGLHCIGCFINLFETLEQGVLGHGLSAETMNDLIDDLNKMAVTKEKDFEITDLAAEKAKALIAQHRAEAIRITIDATGHEYRYDMDFGAKRENDEVIDVKGVIFLIDKPRASFLKNTILDYITTNEGEGFKFEKVK